MAIKIKKILKEQEDRSNAQLANQIDRISRYVLDLENKLKKNSAGGGKDGQIAKDIYKVLNDDIKNMDVDIDGIAKYVTDLNIFFKKALNKKTEKEDFEELITLVAELEDNLPEVGGGQAQVEPEAKAKPTAKAKSVSDLNRTWEKLHDNNPHLKIGDLWAHVKERVGRIETNKKGQFTRYIQAEVARNPDHEQLKAAADKWLEKQKSTKESNSKYNEEQLRSINKAKVSLPEKIQNWVDGIVGRERATYEEIMNFIESEQGVNESLTRSKDLLEEIRINKLNEKTANWQYLAGIKKR
ncbi:hypothetical protein OAT10_00360 [Luminiphilus sp.]|nr:hypothetical protein [Luminiphilus sp.]